MKKAWIIVLAVLLLLGLSGVGSYNNLVRMNETINGNWAQINVQLQRRADLIPNLVNTVKGYAAHEQSILNNLANARASLLGAKTPAEAAAANDELSSTLSRLLVIVENYPNLKADANFRQLMDELAGTENRIAVARKDYNDSVKTYNARVKSFPTSIWAGMLGFESREYFQAEESAQTVPQVNF
ncbi:MAG: LemA family protein [Syntrophomonadaceae bacterium]